MSTVVAGLGVSGVAAARSLLRAGERVVVVETHDGERQRAAAAELEALGAEVRFGGALPADAGLVVTSPGWRPGQPLLAEAAARGVEVIGEVELAWRRRPPGAAPWLAVTGTNGKTTAVRMLTAMLRAAGLDAAAVGNVGTPITEAVERSHDVLAVELSSFQLHWSATLAPRAAAVLNVAGDHLDWHGSMEEYARAKGRVYERAEVVVYNADDAWSTRLAAPYARADGGPRVVSFTLRVPAPGQIGVVEDILVDRAFTADPVRSAEELATLEDVRPFAPHNVANALAAAALARAHGVSPDAVRRGLRDHVPDPHRIAHVARVAEVDYVDDSKATNPHAAAASLAAYRSVVWVAGGLLKGAEVDELVRAASGRLRAAVLLGADRARIREALARHAANVPVVEVEGQDTGVMDRVVNEAARLASPGDTVLLAPAGASMDIFTDYGARGEAFARAVHRLATSGVR
ncbi:UDP-N-acetylmuramoylalanine--D-glutamate ligase [Sphaerisporangium melleum]|uniref:UDP-N-acetylmuramoylalanine--D-glutamate ligase n=1 Tax=Sphaerisporangium melleum TaxID=321316 RepID=A0A917RA46_9ACTN|nr:UDP-N-acetylmuramoyl-L-alanine--D-glutamate ligase [Sphaerisporangium melleum]GGK98205.1 UDP-N-acetylmuramoylalanine--D-glutamate ligase [Sphaerisporangium melleum]GII73712.1 UDP-N-acetylmuramoylalanine--D-glutamate ligase [Sphaerisporangium melleum]